MIIDDCDDCHYYNYDACYGSDCANAEAPPNYDRGDEPLAENRHGNFPKWCPMVGRVEKFEWCKIK